MMEETGTLPSPPPEFCYRCYNEAALSVVPILRGTPKSGCQAKFGLTEDYVGQRR